MTPALPLCVIGGGSIGYRHATQAVVAQGVELTAVVEPSPARRAELVAEGLPAVAALGDVPARTRAAVVATPSADHHASGLAALGRGWATLIEKPLATTLEEADALIDAASAAGLPLFTGYHRRCHPFIPAALERLAHIGAVVAVQGLWSLRKHDSYYDPNWRRASGAGPVLTNLSHEIDLLHCLVGAITEVTALGANAARGLAIEDTAAIALRFESGALGSFLISDAGASPFAFELATGENPDLAGEGCDPLRFIGTQGSLSFPSLDLWTGGAGTDWRSALSFAPGPDFAPIDPIRTELERFAASVRDTRKMGLATGQDGRANVAVIDAVLASIRTGAPQNLRP